MVRELTEKEFMIKRLIEAIQFASDRHAGQVRPSGESQMTHVLRVVKLVAEYLEMHDMMNTCGAGTFMVSAILHDVLEDTSTTNQEIAEKFGNEVAKIVKALSHESEEEPDEVYLHRVADGGTVAIIVKRCDRLDNLQTLVNTPPEFRARKCGEVRMALPIWQEIDPEGAVEIEKEVRKYE